MAIAASARAAAGMPGLQDERLRSAGLGQIVINATAEDTLVAYGLGSCVAVVGYDPVSRVGGLLHALLPQHRNADPNRAKFVDTGVPLLVRQMEEAGARSGSIIWKIVGGAEMLKVPGFSSEFNIGAKNVEMARQVMARLGLVIRAQDVGGSAGRTVRLTVKDGVLTVRTLGLGERPL